MAHFEKPYVTRLHNVCVLSEVKPVFTFEHPNPSTVIDNSRYTCLEFTATEAGMLHGFAGYFECTLYKGVLMSTNPATHSPEMYSWFPIFFPLRVPQYVAKDARVELHMWRVATTGKVWYEWAVTSPHVTPIHNPGGRSYWIGL